LDIWDDIEIIGDTQLPVVIDAAGIDRVLEIVGVTAEISNVTITGGSCPGFGAGVYIVSSSVSIKNSAIRGNHAVAYDGGGISVALGDLVLINSTVSGNSAARSAGGIDRTAGPGEANVTLITSTVSGNYAGQGGGIYSDGRGDLTLINSTVSGNTSYLSVSGIFSELNDGPVMTNTIVMDRCGFYYSAVPRSSGGNIEATDSDCRLRHPADRQIDPSEIMLGPLTYNGGPTMTHALLPGSPAIDAGVTADCPATDQRGRPRPIDGNGDGTATCDAGAYEFNPRAVDIPAVNPVGLAVFAALIAAIALVKVARWTPDTVPVAGPRPSTRGHEAIGD
ncbi:MAG: right-handed parallel beta-helix repeat-containing protein, partial [bacterium]|nr:right-handed parallel beta-helix repeat-containing protein [bacterium]